MNLEGASALVTGGGGGFGGETTRHLVKAGAKVVVAAIPFPLQSGQQVIDAVLAKATARTKLLLIDHVTSPTGLVLPIAPIVAALRDRGVETLVDGAMFNSGQSCCGIERIYVHRSVYDDAGSGCQR